MQITDMTAELRAGLRDFVQPGGTVSPDALAAAFAPHLVRGFRIAAPDAPGLHFVGAQLRVPGLGPLSVGGTGLTEAQAIAGCLGEAFERLSQVDDGSVALRDGAAAAGPPVLAQWTRDHARGGMAGDALDWIAGQDLARGATVEIPADFCLRRPPARRRIEPDFPLSVGCAAGPTMAAAREAAALELIERDAASLWWIGGAPGAALPADDAAAAAAIVAALRGASAVRHTWLLDITSDLGVPCVAAMSANFDGRGLAFGLAARLDRKAAARAALLELGQMELALHISQAKAAANGREALNAVERAQLDRAREIDAPSCRLLHPRRAEASPDSDYALAAPSLSATATGQLQNRGLEIFSFDLTRVRFGVKVVRLVAPMLQILPCDHRGERLNSAHSRYGGGVADSRNLPLM